MVAVVVVLSVYVKREDYDRRKGEAKEGEKLISESEIK